MEDYAIQEIRNRLWHRDRMRRITKRILIAIASVLVLASIVISLIVHAAK